MDSQKYNLKEWEQDADWNLSGTSIVAKKSDISNRVLILSDELKAAIEVIKTYSRLKQMQASYVGELHLLGILTVAADEYLAHIDKTYILK